MARVNIYLPDDLAAEVKEAGLNVSKVAQEALRTALGGHRTNQWLAEVAKGPKINVSHERVLEVLDEVRAEMDADWDEHFGYAARPRR